MGHQRASRKRASPTKDRFHLPRAAPSTTHARGPTVGPETGWWLFSPVHHKLPATALTDVRKLALVDWGCGAITSSGVTHEVFPQLRALLLTEDYPHATDISGIVAFAATLTHLELDFGDLSWYGGLGNGVDLDRPAMDTICLLGQLKILVVRGMRCGDMQDFKSLERLSLNMEILHVEAENESSDVPDDYDYESFFSFDDLSTDAQAISTINLTHLTALRKLTFLKASFCTAAEKPFLAPGAQALVLGDSLEEVTIGGSSWSCTAALQSELKQLKLRQLRLHGVHKPKRYPRGKLYHKEPTPRGRRPGANDQEVAAAARAASPAALRAMSHVHASDVCDDHLIAIKIVPGMKPGSKILFTHEDTKKQFTFVVPPGAAPGDVFHVPQP